MVDKGFWKNKKVFVTGHTGFKGSWLCLWLHYLGARISGYALEPESDNYLFKALRIQEKLEHHCINDITDFMALREAIQESDPEIIIHMAAQPLVIDSYTDPSRTYQTNAMGTVFLLDVVRHHPSIKAVLNVTTDKVYKNDGRGSGYQETDPLGGSDPYSTSKVCSDVITQSYRTSFFDNQGLAIGRAGNVIGGGDYARNRLIPDIARAYEQKQKLVIRYPMATRPWQHVLEPLHGYLVLLEHLYKDRRNYSQDFNFGPDSQNIKTVQNLLDAVQKRLNNAVEYVVTDPDHHEEILLTLDSTKAHSLLNWSPRWDFDATVDKTITWFQNYWQKKDMESFSINQIKEYMSSVNQETQDSIETPVGELS